MSVRATVYRKAPDGTPRKEVAAQEEVETVMERLARFWSDPYSNLGFLRKAHPNAHPGCYERRRRKRAEASDAEAFVSRYAIAPEVWTPEGSDD